MKRFLFDNKTKMFIREFIPQENPLKSGEYLFPKNSTEVVPPVLNENETAVFNGEFWDIIPDYRGLMKINLSTLETEIISSAGGLNKDEMLYSDYLLSDEYRRFVEQKEREDKISALLEEIKLIDEKRIRAVCEPSLKENGQTWLEYYNSKICELRQQLSEVGYVA